MVYIVYSSVYSMYTIYYLLHPKTGLNLYFLTYSDVLFFKQGISHKVSREFYCTTVYTNDMATYTKALVSHNKVEEKRQARLTYQTH